MSKRFWFLAVVRVLVFGLLLSWLSASPSVAKTITVVAQDLAPLSDIVEVATGYRHTCALTSSGKVLCWGWNNYGQLGDGTTQSRSMPTPVNNLGTDVEAITAGWEHTCALTNNGEVLCWGNNWIGQVGDGTTDNRSTPVQVSGLGGNVLAISAGGYHTCALTSGGAVLCWGWNVYGQLGDNTTDNRSTPAQVVGLESGVQKIAGGGLHTCALTVSGGVRCWGRNIYGQVGDDTTLDKKTPVGVTSLGSSVQQIAAGRFHTCAITNGRAFCWGFNYDGQVGDGTTGNHRNLPTAVSNLGSSVQSISAGGDHTCAVASGGAVFCWGVNGSGQVGDGTTTYIRSTPTSVITLGSGAYIALAGGFHSCAITSNAEVLCWGSNEFGQLGDGTFGIHSLPTEVVGLGSSVQIIGAGEHHTCALTSSGETLCWGYNKFGQLGDSTTESRSTPIKVNGLDTQMKTISGGYFHTCALTSNESVLCWGSNGFTQMGDGTTTDRSTPTAVSGLSSGVEEISSGLHHTCALTSSGSIRCWGYNGYGQLGDGTVYIRSTPVTVNGLGSGVRAIAAGALHTCAINTNGVLCWGNNEFGQLGDGTTSQRNTPTAVSGLGSDTQSIVAGREHTCALTNSGGVLCWGRNRHGQLGDGTTDNRTTPAPVHGLERGVQAIVAGGDHTCALTSNSGVLCWGYNFGGQLGDGTTENKSTPIHVEGMGTSVKTITAGSAHTCALTSSGAMLCWGYNLYGQLGNGAAWQTTPVEVLLESIATPTPTATKTLVPTPTATETPTPTPTTSSPVSKQPIVFVHGINLWGPCQPVDPDAYFKNVDDDLMAAGYDITYAYLETSPCGTPSLIQNVEPLKNAIRHAYEKSGHQKVILITHSMGGLVSRAYIEGSSYQDDVSMLFTFGSPHTGIPIDALVFLANGVGPNGLPFLPTFCEIQMAICDFTLLGMEVFNRMYPSRREHVTYYAVSGDAPFFSRSPFGQLMDVIIFGEDDGIVPFASGVGLEGLVLRAISDEVHNESFGSNSYFVGEQGPSASYLECLKPVLIDKLSTNCGSRTRIIDSAESIPTLTVRLAPESGTLHAGHIITRSISLSDGAAFFAAQWQVGSVAAYLLSPTGQTIDSAYAASHPSEVSYETDGVSTSYYLTNTISGTWHLVLHATESPAEGSPYTTFAAFQSDIALQGDTDRLWYLPDTSATITATLSGLPTSAVITATILRTDDVTDTIVLEQTSPGTFTGQYTIPNAPGYTELRLTAKGTTQSAIVFERSKSLVIQIATLTAELSDSYADQGKDSEGDGLYESLAVDVGVTAIVSGTYALTADLFAADGVQIDRTTVLTSLVSGSHILTLYFDGNRIQSGLKNGPYRVRNIMLIDATGAVLPVAEAQDVWTTAAYKWQEFGTPQHVYLPSVRR